MRDLLTVAAGLVIAVLVALLAVPPLVDWTAHRDLVDAAIARAVGGEARTEGALSLRILPSPRIRMERLRLGSPDPASASLDAIIVKAEIALTPLLGGEVRFLDAKIGRAEIKLPTGASGNWRVPRALVGDGVLRRAWMFDDLSVQQFLLTTVDPRTGRTDQAYAEDVRLQAGSLAGPWRMQGAADGLPFEIALGEIGSDLSATLKGGIGGGGLPRLDVDGRLELTPDPAGDLVPSAAGTVRLLSPPGRPAASAFRAQAGFKALGGSLALAELTLEAGEGARTLRLTGDGTGRIDEPRLSLRLAGRRADLASEAGRPRELLAGLRVWRPDLPIDLSLRLDSVGVGGDEDLTGLSLVAALEGDRLRVSDVAVSGPGRSTLKASGEVALGDVAGGSGRVAVETRDGERLARFMRSLGLERTAALAVPGGFTASADVTVSDPILSVRNVRVAAGDTTLTGTARYTGAQAGARARLDAQIAVQGLDILALPDGAPFSALARDTDLGLTLDGRDVAYGPARGGRIAGRIATDGSAILVERLEVRDLAGADADLSGRVSPDGTGRIEGRLKAARAAPLVDLFGRAWMGGLVRLVPEVAREGAVDLTVVGERASPGGREVAFRTSLKGLLAGGDFEATALLAGGAVQSLGARGSAPRSDAWIRAGAGRGLGQPARFEVAARREPDGRLALSGTGEVGGVRLVTASPMRLGPDDDRLDGGEADLDSDDASALLAAFGLPPESVVPLSLRLTLARPNADLRVVATGQLAGTIIVADLGGPSADALAGSVTVGRLSLPWLLSAAVLGPQSPAGSAAIWPSARFALRPVPPVGGTVRMSVRDLAFGGGVTGRKAIFDLASRPDGVEVSGLSARIGGGRLSGGFSLERQGGLASLIGEGAIEGVEVPSLVGPPFKAGRIAAKLRFGASGESLAALASNLGGAGEVAVEGLAIDAADPGAVSRVAGRVLRSDDPLATRRWQGLLPEELGRGSLSGDRLGGAGSLVGGTLRFGPLRIDGQGGTWEGAASVDLRSLGLDMRGTLRATESPRGWTGPPPAIGLGWSGALATPARRIDTGPLVNGLAEAVLARELDRIDTFDRDAAERQRLNARVGMERQRRIDAEEARQARLKEEAAERAREAERQRQERERQEAERKRDEIRSPNPRPSLPGSSEANPSEGPGRGREGG